MDEPETRGVTPRRLREAHGGYVPRIENNVSQGGPGTGGGGSEERGYSPPPPPPPSSHVPPPRNPGPADED